MLSKLKVSLGLLSMAWMLRAQAPTGEITGAVTDQTARAVAGAGVVITNVNTNIQRSVLTNATGIYDAPALPPGTYSVKVNMPGFKSEIRNDLVLQVDQVARLDFALQVGNVSGNRRGAGTGPHPRHRNRDHRHCGRNQADRRVTAERTQLSPTGIAGARRDRLRPGKFHRPGARRRRPQQFPAQHRRASAWRTITTRSTASRTPIRIMARIWCSLPSTRCWSSRSKPARTRRNTATILPRSTSLPRAAPIPTTAPCSSFSAIRIWTPRISLPSRARQSSVQAQSVWRRGRRTRPDSSRRQRQEQAVFLFQLRRTAPGESPDAAFRPSRSLPTARGTTPVRARSSTIRPRASWPRMGPAWCPWIRFPTTRFPAGRIHPVSTALLNYYPLPNNITKGYANDFVSNESSSATADGETARIDWQQAVNSNFQFRYSHGNEPQYIPANIPQQGTVNSTVTHQAMLGHTWVVGPNKVNDFKFGLSRLELVNGNPHTGKNDIVGQLGHSLCARHAAVLGYPVHSVHRLHGVRRPGQRTRIPTGTRCFQWSDNFSWNKGKHAFKFGGEYMRTRFNLTGNDVARGRFTFNGQYTSAIGVAPTSAEFHRRLPAGLHEQFGRPVGPGGGDAARLVDRLVLPGSVEDHAEDDHQLRHPLRTPTGLPRKIRSPHPDRLRLGQFRQSHVGACRQGRPVSGQSAVSRCPLRFPSCGTGASATPSFARTTRTGPPGWVSPTA